MKRWVRRISAIVLALVLIGALVIVSGVIPITASSGHWPITEWFLHFTMRRSVATHSLGIKAPPLDDPALLLKGATHYEIGCRSCHGSPDAPMPRIPRAMTPHPPELPPRIREMKDSELFYVVKHGVKFTGMPAWPAQGRDDEVWAVVAFLRKMPELDEAKYHRLIHGEPTPAAPMESLGGEARVPRVVTENCARCHGRDGLGRGSDAFPVLAGQRAEYFENALQAYARGERHSGIMEPIATGLNAQTMRELAQHYAALPPRKPQGARADSAAIARGESIARRGIPAQRVPSCVECHEPAGRRHKPAYPSLAGQPARYLELQLELFRSNQRGGSANAHLMQAVAPRLTPEQSRDVALYFESLTPSPPSATPP